MEFSRQQETALQSVNRWLQSGDDQVFRLFGFAGTGKTTLAKYLAQGVDGRVLFAAYTGKAAYVLRTKGCSSASTLHSLIYNPKDKSRERLRELEGRLEACEPEEKERRAELERMILEEGKNLSRPSFSLKLDSDLAYSKLLIVDECSMVDERMGEDILGFGKKVLVLGDPAQLPPVMGGGFFTEHKPDVMLTEIHRQAAENPIIWLSREVREKRVPDIGDYGESRVVRRLDPEEAKSADQILVGRNGTRFRSNQRIRSLLNLDPIGPVGGDRLVCLRNDGETGLINGAIWNVVAVGDRDEERVFMSVQSDDTDTIVDVEAHAHYFRGGTPPWWEKREAQEFDYGYALTVHKSQGSQWDNVALIDESRAFRQDWWRWLYTGVTRAAERLDIVRSAA